MGIINVEVMGVLKRLKKWKLKWSDAEKERNLGEEWYEVATCSSSVQDECACTRVAPCRARKRRDQQAWATDWIC